MTDFITGSELLKIQKEQFLMNTEIQLSFGQKIDEDNGLIMPWFTWGCLDWIKEQEWSGKNVLMFGAGLGDAWLGKRCKHLIVIERNEEWLNKASSNTTANGVYNVNYDYVPCNDSSGMADHYIRIPEGVDVIINDDAYRYEVCVKAVEYFKNKGGGILITDNWQQSYVFMCPAADELLKPYEAHIHEQADHLDNDGINKWKTAIHFIR